LKGAGVEYKSNPEISLITQIQEAAQ